MSFQDAVDRWKYNKKVREEVRRLRKREAYRIKAQKQRDQREVERLARTGMTFDEAKARVQKIKDAKKNGGSPPHPYAEAATNSGKFPSSRVPSAVDDGKITRREKNRSVRQLRELMK